MSKTLVLSALVALTQARFGQEQLAVGAVAALTDRGNPGDAGTLSGQVPGVLLAGANACAKLQLADKIVETLGNTDDVIQAAIGLVAAEKNFNPFAVSIPSICGDAGLPATAALQGIVPLIDPAVTGSDVENANSAKSVTAPFAAKGQSVADVMKANGFSNFTVQNADGSAGAAPAGGDAAAADASAASAATPACGGAAAAATTAAAAAADSSAAADAGAGAAASSNAAVDFGQCTPTMDFQLGRPGRKADEGTFLPTDALVAKGQQDALNPNIITNRICDQLTNVCDANQAAKDLCEQAKKVVSDLGTKDATTATAFNQALGFAS